MKKPKQEIQEAGKAARKINALLARLNEANREGEGLFGGECHWAHVETLRGIAADLQQLSDRVFSEGEYAPTARCPECGDDCWTPGTVCEFCAAHGFEHEAK